MGDAEMRVRARVRHQPDRSYAVLVEGPDGEVEVGHTTRTSELRAVARAGAARLFGVPAERLAGAGVTLLVPRPPYGRDGQWVRIVAVENPDDRSETADVGVLAQARWSDHEAAWFVTVTGSGTGIVASEHLDFEPVVTDAEVAAFHAYVTPTTESAD